MPRHPDITMHFDPNWDIHTGEYVTLDGKDYELLRCRADKSDPNYARIPSQAKPWRNTPYFYTRGTVGGDHAIVYVAPRTYARVPWPTE